MCAAGFFSGYVCCRRYSSVFFVFVFFGGSSFYGVGCSAGVECIMQRELSPHVVWQDWERFITLV